MNELPHELEAFLADPPNGRAAETFRERLREETETLLPAPRAPNWLFNRETRWMSGASAIGAIACVLMLSVLAVWWLARSRAREQAMREQQMLRQATIFEAPAMIEPPFSEALRLEWQAFDDVAENRLVPWANSQLYWSAGQTYIAMEGDYLSALRCYEKALNTEETIEITDEDDVLALALKLERSHQEKRHDAP
jgi:tetratricopeptide (TPR) repeat protein